MRLGVVDIGGTKIATGIVTSGRLDRRREAPTSPERGFDDTTARIASMLLESANGGDEPFAGVAIGSTGPIDRDTGVFGQVDTLPGFRGSNLIAALRARLLGRLVGRGESTDLPFVIENDADAAALGEAAFGAGRGHKRFLYVTISTGIGGGFVVDGQIYRGANGAHPEIGHHIVDAMNGPLCSCGARGCWEAVASGPAMSAFASAADSEHGVMSAEVICDHARRSADVSANAWARAVVDREGFYLGVGLTNLVAMFAPDVIALGGGVMKSADLFLDRAREVMKTSCTIVPYDTTKIVLASLGADAVLLGAARAFALTKQIEKT